MFYLRLLSYSLPLLFYITLLVGSPFYKPPLLRSPASTTVLEKVTDVFLFGYYYHKGLVLDVIEGWERSSQAYAQAAWYRPELLLTIFGTDPHHSLNVARLYEQVKLDGLAERLYLSWLESQPTDIAAYEQIRNFMMRLENWPETIKITQKLLSLKPEDPYEYYYLGVGYTHTHQWDPARAAFKKSLLLKPDLVEAHLQLEKIGKARGDTSNLLLDSK